MKSADLVIEIDNEGDTSFYLIPRGVAKSLNNEEDWMEYIADEGEEHTSFETALAAIRHAEDTGIKVFDEFHFRTY